MSRSWCLWHFGRAGGFINLEAELIHFAKRIHVIAVPALENKDNQAYPQSRKVETGYGCIEFLGEDARVTRVVAESGAKSAMRACGGTGCFKCRGGPVWGRF